MNLITLPVAVIDLFVIINTLIDSYNLLAVIL